MGTTLYIRVFSDFRKFGAIHKHRQIVDLAFEMNNIWNRTILFTEYRNTSFGSIKNHKKKETGYNKA